MLWNISNEKKKLGIEKEKENFYNKNFERIFKNALKYFKQKKEIRYWKEKKKRKLNKLLQY